MPGVALVVAQLVDRSAASEWEPALGRARNEPQPGLAWRDRFLHSAPLPKLIEALELCDRLLRDDVPGYRPEPELRRRLETAPVPP
jgi:hypothetical protein